MFVQDCFPLAPGAWTCVAERHAPDRPAVTIIPCEENGIRRQLCDLFQHHVQITSFPSVMSCSDAPSAYCSVAEATETCGCTDGTYTQSI